MQIEIDQDINLKLFEKSLTQKFFDAIHSNENREDEYVSNLQRKYDQYEKLEERITDAIDNKFKSDGTPDFFIFYQEQLAGIFEFHPLSEEDFIEVGYWLFPEYRRKRIISAIFPKMIQYTRDHFFKDKILATTSVDNLPSQKLLDNVQFQKTGRILEFKQKSGEVEKEIEYVYPLNYLCVTTEKYEIAYPDPLILKPGDEVTIIESETGPEWIGWHFCKDQSGKEGWISEKYMRINSQLKTGTITNSYTAKELNIEPDQEVEVTNESFGWVWCKTENDEGWLPKNILKDLR